MSGNNPFNKNTGGIGFSQSAGSIKPGNAFNWGNGQQQQQQGFGGGGGGTPLFGTGSGGTALFGNANTSTTTTVSPFGAAQGKSMLSSNSMLMQSAGNNPFGVLANQETNKQSSAFGAAASNNSAFGGNASFSSFGAQSSSGNALFGNTSTSSGFGASAVSSGAQSSGGNALFGNTSTSSGFGASAASTGGNALFGNASSSGGFGSTSASFGKPSSAPAASSALTSSSAFSNTTSGFSSSNASGSSTAAFGKSTAFGSGFGSSSSSTTMSGFGSSSTMAGFGSSDASFSSGFSTSFGNPKSSSDSKVQSSSSVMSSSAIASGTSTALFGGSAASKSAQNMSSSAASFSGSSASVAFGASNSASLKSPVSGLSAPTSASSTAANSVKHEKSLSFQPKSGPAASFAVAEPMSGILKAGNATSPVKKTVQFDPSIPNISSPETSPQIIQPMKSERLPDTMNADRVSKTQKPLAVSTKLDFKPAAKKTAPADSALSNFGKGEKSSISNALSTVAVPDQKEDFSHLNEFKTLEKKANAVLREKSKIVIPESSLFFPGEGHIQVTASSSPRQLFVIVHKKYMLLLNPDMSLKLAPLSILYNNSATKPVHITYHCSPSIQNTKGQTSGPFLKINSDSSKVVIYWELECYVIYLPPLSEIESAFEDLKKEKRITLHQDILCTKQFLVLPILQLDWHPLSPNHLFILNLERLNLYNFGKESKTWELWIDSANSVSFCFGGGDGWSIFSIILIKRNGELHGICPIIPFSAAISAIQLESMRSYKTADALTQKNLDIILGDFQYDEYSGSYLYLPKSILPNLKLQKIVSSTSKIVLPSNAQAIKLFSTPDTHPFLHCMAIYDSGHVDVLIAETGIEPAWGIVRSGIQDKNAMRMLNVYRYEISDWMQVPQNMAYVETYTHPSEIDGFLIRYGPHVYAVQLLEILNVLLSLDDIPEGEEPNESIEQLFSMTWSSSIVSFKRLSENELDISCGLQFIETGVERKLLVLNPDFRFFTKPTSDVKGLYSEAFDPEMDKSKIRVDVSSIEGLQPVGASSSKIENLKKELHKLMPSLENSALDRDPKIAKKFRDLVLEINNLAEEPEFTNLQDAFVELKNLSKRAMRMESTLIDSIRYSEQDKRIAKTLEDIQRSVPVISKSIEILNSAFSGLALQEKIVDEGPADEIDVLLESIQKQEEETRKVARDLVELNSQADSLLI